MAVKVGASKQLGHSSLAVTRTDDIDEGQKDTVQAADILDRPQM